MVLIEVERMLLLVELRGSVLVKRALLLLMDILLLLSNLLLVNNALLLKEVFLLSEVLLSDVLLRPGMCLLSLPRFALTLGLPRRHGCERSGLEIVGLMRHIE